MAEYIDKQKTLNVIFEIAENVIKSLPSADVQPVRHGHWDETTEPCGWTDEDRAECSECHNSFVLGVYTMEDIRESFKYCPNCGARMDGEQKD